MDTTDGLNTIIETNTSLVESPSNPESAFMDVIEDVNPESISESAETFLSLVDKNPVSIVLEHAAREKTTVTFSFNQPSSGGFLCVALLDEDEMRGVACRSKRDAKLSCCRVIIDRLIQLGWIDQQKWIPLKSNNGDDKPGVVGVDNEPKEGVPPCSDSPNPELISQATHKYIEESGRNAVNLVMGFLQTYGVALPSSCFIEAIGNEQFRYSVSVMGTELRGLTCNSKSKAKESCCRIAVDYLIKKGKIHIPTDSEVKVHLDNNKFDHMRSTLYATFASAVIRNPELAGSDKVIAGLYMLDGAAGKCHLVSWATGNKTVKGSALCTDGETVNDSHAEVLCRRGLLRFLYQQVELYLRDSTASILVKAKGKLSLRTSLSFHLFISSAPCGDGRIFSFFSEDSTNGSAHKPSVDKNKGTLRTKIECGEGTVPIPDDVSCQTMDGIYGGERLRTMSCSDKVLKWNALGLQGCLLSALMRPIYMETLTIEQLFHYGHLSRSVCCRMGDALKLPAPFVLNHPYLASCTSAAVPRTSMKSSSLAANWNISDDSVEVICAHTGKVRTTGKMSRLCKRSLYACFSSVEEKVRRPSTKECLDESYLTKKEYCEDYIQARDFLYATLLDNGYGRWLKKPDEEKMFRLHN